MRPAFKELTGSSSTEALCVLAAVHMVAHLLNVEWYNNSRQGVYDNLSIALSNLEDTENTTYLNPIRITDLVSSCNLPFTEDHISGGVFPQIQGP